MSAFAKIFQQLQQQAVPSGGLGGGQYPSLNGFSAAEAAASFSPGTGFIGKGGDGLIPSPGKYTPGVYLGGSGAGLCGGEAAATGDWSRYVSGGFVDGGRRGGSGARGGLGVESGERRRSENTDPGDMLPF